MDYSNFGCKRGLFGFFLVFSKSENCYGIKTGTFGGVKEKEKIDFTYSAFKMTFFVLFQPLLKLIVSLLSFLSFLRFLSFLKFLRFFEIFEIFEIFWVFGGSLFILSHFSFWVTFYFGVTLDFGSLWIWNQLAYLGGVCFLIFCDLVFISGFWILKGHFLVWFLSFENFESCFVISEHIWGMFFDILWFEVFLGFWI